MRGRGAAGGCPPAAPTDPDVPHSSIRLLGLWTRYATVHTMHDTRLGEGKGLAQLVESLPRHPPAPRTPVQPLAPSPLDYVSLDVTAQGPGPRFGLELYRAVRWLEADRRGWRPFISRLEGNGWCLPAKAEGLRRWSGVERLIGGGEIHLVR